VAEHRVVDRKGRVLVPSVAGLKNPKAYYLARHPAGENILALLSHETKTLDSRYKLHLRLLGVHPASIEGQEVVADNQGRIRIPRGLCKTPNFGKEVTFANIGGVHFIFTAPNLEERMAAIKAMTNLKPEEHRVSGKSRIITTVPSAATIRTILESHNAVRMGTKEHRKKLMFPRPRHQKPV